MPFLGEEFLPNFREYDFLMHWVEKPGTSIDAMRRITVARQPGTDARFPACATSARTSAAPKSPTKWSGRTSPSCGSASIPSVDYEATVAKIQAIVDGYPGLYRDLLTYLRERIKEVLTGASATIVVRVVRTGAGTTAGAGRSACARAIADVGGVADLKVQPQVLVPQIEVRFDPERAAAFGLTPGECAAPRRPLVQGTKVGEFYEDQRFFDVVVWGTQTCGTTSTRFAPCRCRVAAAAPCRSETSWPTSTSTPTPNEITRENGSRRIDVTSNVRGRDLGAVARDIQTRLAGVQFRAGLLRRGAGRVRRAPGVVEPAAVARWAGAWSPSS